MTFEPGWLREAGCALVGVGLGAMASALARGAQLPRRAAAHAARLSHALAELQRPRSGPAIACGQAVLGALGCGLAGWRRTPQPLLLLAIAAWAPGLWLAWLRRGYAVRIERQLDGWLLALSNALRASPSLGDALLASAELVAAPLAGELLRVVSEQRLGVPLDRALAHMAQRVGSPVVTAALAVLRIARGSGGDLHRTLESVAASLRELARLEGVVRTKTAEGRAQSLVIAGAPLGLIPLLDALDPRFLAPLWSSAFGQLLLAIAAGLWALALLLARKITAVDI